MVVGRDAHGYEGYGDELKAWVQGKGLAEYVQFLGFRSDIPELMAALERGARVVAKGGRYIIDSLVQPGYADSGTDQRATMAKKKVG